MITQVNLLNNVMIVFQVSLNFDSVKEILKKRCHIYILMKKVITLRKIQVKMKTSAPLFFSHFSACLNKKKRARKKNAKTKGE